MRVHGLACSLVLAILLSGCIQVQVGTQGQPPAAAGSSAPPQSTATFTWSPKEPEAGQVVTFTARVSSAQAGDSIRAVHWDFGDGGTDRGMNAVHVFAAGSYAVRLTVDTALSGRLTSSQPLTLVGASAAAPTNDASVQGPAVNYAAPTILADVNGSHVRFSFSTDYVPELVYWSFGDGATSNRSSPEHTYLAQGTFHVRLRTMVDASVLEATLALDILGVTLRPRVVVGVSDSGINPYHEIYYRPQATAHPCTYVGGYTDCSIPALNLSVGPEFGSYAARLELDRAVWSTVKPMTWYWIPQTPFIAVHCPTPYQGDVTTTGTTYSNAVCILDDTQTHGTQTTSSVLTEAPEALLVFNEGSGSAYLADSPVAIDIESNSWGSLGPLYGGLVNGPTGQQVCHDSIDAPTSLKFRSAGNNGPVPNLGDCWRNGYRTYSVSGGYPDGSHGELSGSMPDFASYWCRPVARPDATDGWRNSCGTSFAAPTAAGTAAAALLGVRLHLDYVGGSSLTEVAPGITHEAFMDAVIQAATYDPQARDGFPSGSLVGPATSTTPWVWWGWGWLDSQVASKAVACALGDACPDNKPAEAWAFNDVRRAFASDGDPL